MLCNTTAYCFFFLLLLFFREDKRNNRENCCVPICFFYSVLSHLYPDFSWHSFACKVHHCPLFSAVYRFSYFSRNVFPMEGGRVMRRCWVNFQCRAVLLIWIIVEQGPIALAVGAGGGCLDIFTLIYLFSLLSPSLWETARYRLKHYLKGPLNPKQPTNQPMSFLGQKILGCGKTTFLFLTMARSSSYSPMASWICLRTSF